MQFLPPVRADSREREVNVLDLVFLAATAGFFLLALAYVRGCDHL